MKNTGKGVLHLNPIAAASSEAKSLILEAMGRLVADGVFPAEPLPAFNIEIPADRAHGDFAANVAMVSAKALHMPPRKIAEAIAEQIDLQDTSFDKIEIAGPGFMNFYLSQSWYSGVIANVIAEGQDYGKSDTGKNQRVLVEFVSANPTGPMHVGNARGGAIGDSLVSVLQAAGYTAEREFYINDAGNQIEKFGKSLSLRYMQLCSDAGQAVYKAAASTEEVCKKIYGDNGNTAEFPMPEDVYLGQDIIAHAKNYYDLSGDSLKDLPDEERRKALVAFALPKNIQGLKDDLAQYRIHYDTWFPESRLHADGSVTQIIQLLKDSGYTYEKDGALWFKAEELGADKDFVIVRSNGIPTYVVPDIAYHYNKLVVRKFDRAIDILGADHHGYVPRLKAALTALGVDASKLTVVLMQMVAVMRDGQPVKQSKRSGKALTLVTLLEDIPVDAARFFFNLREANSHFEFDLDLAVEKSSSNPVYYVQYAHARICSLIRNLAETGISVPKPENTDLSVLSSVPERELIRQLALLPAEIEAAAKQLDPSRLTKYSVDLAAQFHKFYDACKVRDAETAELREARLLLCDATCRVLGNVLSLLKVTAPQKM
ncbi:MAG: arginine--tRNA ligase [Oscillospiraceae bacterium]|nr:arginine--tRNA ligase [Oscillospiraceae bacterium]